MRPRRILGTLIGSLAAIGALAPAAAPEPLAGIGSHLSCIAAGDSAGIDAALARAQSPMVGEGARFVAEGRRIGVDPRALVAIAAHETLLATYAPAQRLRNAFGLGPGWSFDSHGDGIARAAKALEDLYLPEGRIDIPTIGSKWAPVGAANDPTGLNQHWAVGVGTYYRALGGDPERPILIDSQPSRPDCAPAPVAARPDRADEPGAVAGVDDAAAPSRPQPSGPPVVTAWGGLTPPATGDGASDGVDPVTGEPATIAGFAFPLALQRGARAEYADHFSLPGAVECEGRRLRCALSIESDRGAVAVAAATGVLEHAEAAEREEGIAFWIRTEGGDRLGYGALTDYDARIVPGAPVAVGQSLGAAPAALRFTWERDGVRINPHPLLSVTRASIGPDPA